MVNFAPSLQGLLVQYVASLTPQFRLSQQTTTTPDLQDIVIAQSCICIGDDLWERKLGLDASFLLELRPVTRKPWESCVQHLQFVGDAGMSLLHSTGKQLMSLFREESELTIAVGH